MKNIVADLNQALVKDFKSKLWTELGDKINLGVWIEFRINLTDHSETDLRTELMQVPANHMDELRQSIGTGINAQLEAQLERELKTNG